MFVVYSASRTRIAADPYAFVTRQVVFAIMAVLVMSIVMSFDYEWWKERAAFLYGLTLVFLALLFLLGIASGEDKISFDFGPLNFQPAEMAKFTTLLMLASYLAEERGDEVSYARFLGGLMIVGAPAVLVIIQPDLGSASVIVSVAMGVLARRRCEGEVHRPDHVPVGDDGAGRVRRTAGERLPVGAHPGLVQP